MVVDASIYVLENAGVYIFQGIQGLIEFLSLKKKSSSSTEAPKKERASSSDTIYRVQVGAFKDKKNAEALVKTLKGKGFDAIIKEM